MPCPFLEDESCSIHPERPLVCREYLVTSPAELCAGPAQEGVTPVPVPKVSLAARGLQEESDDWFPLALLMAWARDARRAAKRRPGPEWVQRFLQRLALDGDRRDRAATLMAQHRAGAEKVTRELRPVGQLCAVNPAAAGASGPRSPAARTAVLRVGSIAETETGAKSCLAA